MERFFSHIRELVVDRLRNLSHHNSGANAKHSVSKKKSASRKRQQLHSASTACVPGSKGGFSLLMALPQELTLEVVSYLRPRDVFQLMQANRELSTLCLDNHLWRQLVRNVLRVSYLDASTSDREWMKFCQEWKDRKVDFDISYHDAKRNLLGCRHYRRNCKLRAACCGRFFVCRFCHDEAGLDHKINSACRYQTKEMLCMRCFTIQPAGGHCRSAQCGGKPCALYFCPICVFWDDTPNKEIFHCDECRVCYLGRRENFYHCKTCDNCFHKDFMAYHRH